MGLIPVVLASLGAPRLRSAAAARWDFPLAPGRSGQQAHPSHPTIPSGVPQLYPVGVAPSDVPAK